MSKKLLAIVLLFGMVAVNASVYCQSLCIGGHAMHMSSHAIKKSASSMAHLRQAHEQCDMSTKAAGTSDCPHSGHSSSISCDCSGELTVAHGTHLLGGFKAVVAPVLMELAAYGPLEHFYLSPDTPPYEGPPRVSA